MPQFICALFSATHQPSASRAITVTPCSLRAVKCAGTASSSNSTTVRRQHKASQRLQCTPFSRTGGFTATPGGRRRRWGAWVELGRLRAWWLPVGVTPAGGDDAEKGAERAGWRLQAVVSGGTCNSGRNARMQRLRRHPTALERIRVGIRVHTGAATATASAAPVPASGSTLAVGGTPWTMTASRISVALTVMGTRATIRRQQEPPFLTLGERRKRIVERGRQ